MEKMVILWPFSFSIFPKNLGHEFFIFDLDLMVLIMIILK
jgi:hypothetical protein